MIPVRHAKLLVCALLLSACAPAPQEPAAVDAAPAPSPVVAEVATDDSLGSIKDVMTSMIVPNAQALWDAVSYVVTAEGTTETVPQTDADWARLRDSANTLMAGGDALLVPGRAVMAGAVPADYPAFQFTPDEIARMLAEDPQTWQGFVERMQESTRLTLQAIELKDVMGLTEWGAQINQACEACHAQYWYRPQDNLTPPPNIPVQ